MGDLGARIGGAGDMILPFARRKAEHRRAHNDPRLITSEMGKVTPSGDITDGTDAPVA